MLDSKTPISTYKFHLEIPGVTDGGEEKEFFISVEGLSKYVSNAQSYFYGGEEHSTYLPHNFSTKDLVLKRPLMKGSSSITDWVQLTLSTFEFEPKDILLTIIAPNEVVLSSWNILGAIPVAFDISTIGLNDKDTTVYQTLIIKYRDLQMTTNQK